MAIKYVFFILLVNISIYKCFSQPLGKTHSLELLFYNTENFFDSFDDSLTLDNEFTPGGMKHWTWKRFKQKANYLYKIFMAAGEWEPPDIIGLAEVENGYVLHYLTRETPFVKFEYGYVHYDSPDRRGIDVALLYRKKNVRILASRPVTVTFPASPEKKTRDILFVLLETGGDTLACFINHWPSRWGGYLETESYRNRVAQVLVSAIDSVWRFEKNRQVVIMGDFNDEPLDQSVSLLSVKRERQQDIVNLMAPLSRKKEGTLFFDHRWWLFDQFMVSGDLIDRVQEVKILRFNFLLQEKTENIPFRTYSGMRYLGGFSDHLPVLLKMEIE